MIIDRIGTSPTIRFTTGNVTIKSLRSTEAFVMSGGSLTVTQPSVVDARFNIGNAASLTVKGPAAFFTTNGETTINGANLYALDGGRISLPFATSYTHTAGAVSDVATLRASGTGSVLDLSTVTSITGGDGINDNIVIDALADGVVDLRAVTNINDPVDGDQRGRDIDITADGGGSLVNLSAMVQLQDQTGADFFGNDGYSQLTSKNGGTIQSPNLTTLNAARITLDGTGTIPISQIGNLTNGQINLSGAASYPFTALTNANGTAINIAGAPATFPVLATMQAGSLTIAGVAISLPALTTLQNGSLTLSGGGTASVPELSNINGASFDVSGGVTLALPAATSYTHTNGTVNDVATFRASGAGSVLDLNKVTSITGGDGINDNIVIDALAGGVVDLRAVTNINDPVDGDQRGRDIDITADGAGSLVNLSALLQFQDQSIADFFGNDGYSSLTAKNGGEIQLSVPSGTSVTAAIVDIGAGSFIQGGLTITGNSTLRGFGTVTGNVSNLGMVNPGSSAGRLTVTGDYSQDGTGTLQIEIGGSGAGVGFDQLRLLGQATIDGTLNLQLINGFSPNIGDTFRILTFGTSSGTFAAINGTNIGGGKVFMVDYNATDVTLTVVAGLQVEAIGQRDAGPGDTGRTAALTEAELAPIVTEAIASWTAAGVDVSASTSSSHFSGPSRPDSWRPFFR